MELKSLPRFAKDFSTPEGALLCLEDAYRRRDIEAAVAAKDFRTEARLMLQETGWKDQITEDNISLTAEALMLSFRAHTTAKWPDFDGMESFFAARQPYDVKVVVITEVCRFPDGGFSKEYMLVSETPEGWRVLHTAPKGWRPEIHKINALIPVKAGDPEFEAAMQQARDRFPEFVQATSAEGNPLAIPLEGSMVKAYFFDDAAPLTGEHMWVKQAQYDGTTISGVLIDTPKHVESVKAGQQVRFPLSRLSDWLYVKGSTACGAFTVKLLRQRMTEAARRAHDAQYPFTFD